MIEVNLFVALTGLHTKAAQDIRHMIQSSGRCILLTFEGGSPSDPALFDQVIYYARPDPSVLAKILGIGRIRTALNRATELCRGCDQVNLFYPHDNHFVSNYLANFLHTRMPAETTITHNIIPDGTMHLHAYEISAAMFGRNLVKKAAMKFVGLDFRLSRGKLLVDSLERVRCYYSYLPSFTICHPSKIVPLSTSAKLTVQPEGDCCLILGQPLELTVSRDYALSLARGLLAYLKQLNAYDTIYYKRHQFRSVMDEVFQGNGIETVESRLGIERLIEEGQIRSRDIYGFSSSALHNIRLFYPNEFRCFAYGLGDIIHHSRRSYSIYKDIRDTYEAIGIILLPHAQKN